MGVFGWTQSSSVDNSRRRSSKAEMGALLRLLFLQYVSHMSGPVGTRGSLHLSFPHLPHLYCIEHRISNPLSLQLQVENTMT